MALSRQQIRAADDKTEPFVPGIKSECCGALVITTTIGGVTWYECKACGGVL